MGFHVDWEHRFDDTAPHYMQVSRDGLIFHLTEHHGDGCPGAAVFIWLDGLDGFLQELQERPYAFARPTIEDAPWQARMLRLIDPFGNRLNFNEKSAS